MGAALEVEIVRDVGRLAALEAPWWRLWERSPAATPFASPAWLVPWWRCFSPGRLATIALHAGDDLVGLAPLYLEEGALGRRLLPLGIGVSDHLDVLLDPGDGPARALASALAGLPEWERVDLEEHPPGAACCSLPVPEGCMEERGRGSACPVLPLGTVALDSVPARQRRKIRMARHRTERRGGSVEIVAPADLPDFLDALARLHMARQADRGEVGVFADERVRAFQGEALPALARAGLLHVSSLRFDGEMAGGYLGFRGHGRAYAYLGGFASEFAFESPGTVLLAQAIEDAAERACREFHFLRGQEPYKYTWGATDRWNERRTFLRSPGSRA